MSALRISLVVLLLAAFAGPASAGFYYRDSDGDGYGFPGFVVVAPSPPRGYVDNDLDCNDNSPLIHPGVTDYCNGLDDDCDGIVDEDVIAMPVYRDNDGDGYGQTPASSSTCPIQDGYSMYPGDCNDADPRIHPSAIERCGNAIDDDCDGQIDEGCGAPFAIADVADVPSDEGHAVDVLWHAHPYDAVAGSPVAIVRYEIRRRPPGGDSLPAYWDVAATVPATGLVDYQASLPTPCSESPASACAVTFVIRAIGDTPGVFFDTAPDSGSAVDNLAPATPAGLTATYVPNFISLEWDLGPSTDIVQYHVWRWSDSDVIPWDIQLVATRTLDDRQFTGAYNGHYYFHYGVSAVDSVGNEGPFGTSSLVAVDPAALPDGIALAPPTPNPSRGTFAFAYDVPAPGTRVRLEVFDLAGRRVRALVDGLRPAGRHVLSWDGTDDHGVPSPVGGYFVRLEAAGKVIARKLSRTR